MTDRKDLKKDHAVGSGAGATAGVVAGAAIGAAVGPIGSAVGAVVGGIAGANAGDAIAEYMNPTEYDGYFQSNYKTRDYYDSRYEWDDYAPAYSLGYYSRDAYRGRKFDEVDNDLEQTWDKAKGKSRMAWNEARDAVHDGWQHVERTLPGDFDNDGR